MSGILGCTAESVDPRQQTLARLDIVRDQAIADVQQHLAELKTTADGIAADAIMMDFFDGLFCRSGDGSQRRVITPDQIQSLNSHYVSRYGIFYDILFVEREGFVFHSIRRESDHRSNLFAGRLAQTKLARNLQIDPRIGFIDFERYTPSGEAAAFFVVSVGPPGEVRGWFVLQYGANALNAMLTDRTDLGRTGEVYLVNAEHQMLSDSRFFNDTTVLELAIDTDAVRNAFTTGKGHTVTRDYRGVQVLSSYDTFEFLDTTWGLFAEIDENEVISAHFQKNTAGMLTDLIQLATGDLSLGPEPVIANDQLTNDLRVDMGELRRVDQGQTCWTPGVGPCTSVVAYYPGRFGYLTHLGPTDDVYIDDALSRRLLGSRRTRSMYELTTRIRHFDVVPNELKDIRFVIVATHTNSVAGILETLLAQGIDLAQIKFIYHPGAEYANVRYDQSVDIVEVQWALVAKPGPARYSRATEHRDMASLLRREQ